MLNTSSRVNFKPAVEIDDLDALAKEVCKHLQASATAAQNFLEHALAAGDALIRAKAQVKHGSWGDWLKKFCSLNERTAQRYMRIAEHGAELNPTRVSDLSMSVALRLISKPKFANSDPTKKANATTSFDALGIDASQKAHSHFLNGHSRNLRRGARIVPSGYSCLSDAVRAGIKLERAGAGAENVHKQIGLTHQTYRSARDIVLLSERNDLSIRDADTVRRALRQFDETRRIKDSAESIKPIALKVWGRKGHRYKSDKKRLEAFLNSISFLETTCTASAEMEIPNLDKQRGSEVTVQLQEAIAALNVLCNEVARILRETGSVEGE